MEYVPTEFSARLERAFNGRLRVRWSQARHEFHLEQKVKRGLADFPVVATDDNSIRLRDGYLFVLSIRPGSRMPCPRCGTTLQVPVREFREISCPLCKLKGLEHRVSAGYFPLDDLLIDYLKRLDPERGASKALRTSVETHNARLLERQRQTVLDNSLNRMDDDFSRIAGIPSVGYTGPTLKG